MAIRNKNLKSQFFDRDIICTNPILLNLSVWKLLRNWYETMFGNFMSNLYHLLDYCKGLSKDKEHWQQQIMITMTIYLYLHVVCALLFTSYGVFCTYSSVNQA